MTFTLTPGVKPSLVGAGARFGFLADVRVCAGIDEWFAETQELGTQAAELLKLEFAFFCMAMALKWLMTHRVR